MDYINTYPHRNLSKFYSIQQYINLTGGIFANNITVFNYEEKIQVLISCFGIKMIKVPFSIFKKLSKS